ncbi:MAG TPA: diguanylate cyclase [Pyrinomonadaceae bacterium]|jgi:diguanylate cyclase (GGDEF)-like protein|nr:diguanylate cyclase [Pyrinomonadaceae bacterium]
MVKKSPIALSPQEHREDAPPTWPETQDSLAESSALALLLVDGHQPPAVVVSNNNSICHTFQSSPEHVALCDPYCGAAHWKAVKARDVVEYKCHAGLSCFAKTVELGSKRSLAVIGGRAFIKSSDYQKLMERFRTGDLKELASENVFANILFSEPQRLGELAERVDRAARRYKTASSNGSALSHQPVAKTETTNAQQDLEREVQRLRSELEYRSRFADSLQHFLERISCADPVKTYNSIITSSKELLQSERASLMVLDETTNALILKAASGLATAPEEVSPVRVGEGISGEVIDTGKAVMVTDLRMAGRRPAPAERKYKTNSFISYPITIGGRKVGVLNVTDKSSGGTYDEVDLSLLEIIGPQVALALERAEWQERATEFQLMSITDALTALPNRRYLEERLAEELNRSKRYEYPMSFLMIDIDDFKAYNDKNGHQAGDLALQITAHCLKGALRVVDVASRYGGEEFCILLPQTAMPEAGVIADRIRHRVSTTHFPHGKSQPLGRVTISVGVSTFTKNIDTPENIIAAADRALYQAKSMGKDRVEFYGERES